MFQKYMEKEFSSALILLCGYIGRFSFGILPTPAGGYCVSTLNYVHKRTQAGRDYCFIRHHASCAEGVAFAIGCGQGTRTLSPHDESGELPFAPSPPYFFMVGPTGIEPVTRGFSVHCYYLLSYGPKL